MLSEVSVNNTDNSGDYIGSGLWVCVYCFVICATFIGNILTIITILISRQLSSIPSYYFILSLAISDLIVGCSIPYHMCFYLIRNFGGSRILCMIRFVLLSFACSCSISNLLCVATDRYIGIIYPLHYNRLVTKKFIIILLSCFWLFALTISLIPIGWNRWFNGVHCEARYVIPIDYFNFILTPMFLLVWLTLLFVYIKIYKEAKEHAKRMRDIINSTRMSYHNDTKHVQVVMLTLGCFSICWMPYFIITTYYRISGGNNSKFNLLYEIAFTMAVSNSGMNPIIYAWKNSNFRTAFWCLLRCQSPNEITKQTTFITNHIPNNNKNHQQNNRTDIEMISSKINNNKNCDECELSHTSEITTAPSI